MVYKWQDTFVDMLNLTYEFKLKPTPEQIQEIERILGICRQVWNYALAERKDWLRSRQSQVNACSITAEYIIPVAQPYPSYGRQCKALTQAKKIYPELKSVNAQVLQQVLRRLETAFVDMQRKGMGFPRFKNEQRMRSFLFPQMLKDCVQGIYLKLPQLGKVEYIKSRDIPEGFVVKQAQIIRKASGYFVALSLACNVDVPDVSPHGYSMGIDLGLDKFLATSEGELLERPRFFDELHRQLKLLQRRLKHKKKGSKNRKKLNKKIARLHETIADTRKDFHFKLAHHLCDSSGMIFVEDINFSTWAKGMLGKHTLDAGLGQFLTILEWVCWKRGVYFAKVNKDYTSQVCPNCDAHTGKKELKDRVHSCPECGYTTHRDVAAAQVVRNRGTSAVGRIVDAKQVACGGGLTGTGNSLVKNQRDRKKEVESRGFNPTRNTLLESLSL
jgi:putative transposase